MAGIYALYDRRNPDAYYYIGKTSRDLVKRFKEHIDERFAPGQKNSWVKETFVFVGARYLEKLNNVDDKTLSERETFYIAKLLHEGHPLLNISFGVLKPAVRRNVQMFVGKKYNSLTVEKISRIDSKGVVFTLCMCDCGKLKSIRLTNVLSGNSKTCGRCEPYRTNTCTVPDCSKEANPTRKIYCTTHYMRKVRYGTFDKPKRRSDEMIGQKYGTITAIARQANGKIAWVCECGITGASRTTSFTATRTCGVAKNHPTKNRNASTNPFVLISAFNRSRPSAKLRLCTKCRQPASGWWYTYSGIDEAQTRLNGSIKVFSTDPTQYNPMCTSCGKRTSVDGRKLRGLLT